MTPTMSLLLVLGLVAGFTLARLPGRRNLQVLPVASRRAAVLIHIGFCTGLGLLAWVFTVGVGTPLTDYLGVLSLLILESLVAGSVSTFILFGRFGLHLSSGVKEYFREIKERNGLGAEKEDEPEEVARFETTHRRLPPGMRVIYSEGKGRWTNSDRALDEEPNSRIG